MSRRWLFIGVVSLVLAGCGTEASVVDPAPTAVGPGANQGDGPSGGSSADRSGVQLRVGDTVSPPVRVEPAPGSPTPQIDRDAGVSARLSDGSTVWFFGDTAERTPSGSLAWFEIGSAAWSRPADPTTTYGGADGDAVVPFAEPTDEFEPCPPEASTAGMWPLAAVIDPTEVDRVVLWMSNICLGGGRTAISRGISVGEWRYDPADPPEDRPIRVTVLDQNLFPDDRYGEAAVVDGERIVVYGCDQSEDPMNGDDGGSCRAARVDPSDVADVDAYEVWTGDGWVVGAPPAPLELAAAPGGGFMPPGPLSVAAAPGGSGYVMLYSPWPGYTPFVEIRGARTPQGPWSAPRTLELPDCEQTYGAIRASCYAANLQPDFSTPGVLGFGYYDQLVASPPQLGSYLLTSVPFELSVG